MPPFDSTDPCLDARGYYFAYLNEGEVGQAYAFADACLSEMEGWADANGCTAYAELVSYARMMRPDWLAVLHTHPDACVHMLAYMGAALLPSA